jgi:hypothetical protein
MKIVRKKVELRFKKRIDEIYKSIPNKYWRCLIEYYFHILFNFIGSIDYCKYWLKIIWN